MRSTHPLTVLFACLLTFAGTPDATAQQPNAAAGEATQTKPSAPQEFRITRVTPEYWRVTIDHPPFNIFGPESIPMLTSVVTQIENDPKVKVVVFDSAVPGFFLTHYDFVPPLEATTSMPAGPTGLPPLPDALVRLSKANVVTIAEIRGRATGVGSELALASDMRFASREKAVLSQFEIGAGFTPGGGPMARLPRLVGRGRALEILLSGNDIPADLAERYGYVNRTLPDAEIDKFVDALARRIASFDKQTIADIKQTVNATSLPADKELSAEWNSFITSVQRPAAQHDIKALMNSGLQKNPEVERHLARYTGIVSQQTDKP
ncbi:enoyl-CoA hydratase/isomerase family protein [Paraburkholderia sp. Cy-641]|uniref:enoyl-CoA hydratase/isomerase family protein n=1 Tax=Paraburkholderia sp. Cy-641 TaxID=2608337 RepID=UPI00141F9D5C|nr:enoyl-CoA hydratase/isomerase family protein [Paraburkholderia sp. Cy-641]NIF76017.1 enoyl-CoA hydratase/isomerase family protein [Paraburkholderia sp. Cy-641]